MAEIVFCYTQINTLLVRAAPILYAVSFSWCRMYHLTTGVEKRRKTNHMNAPTETYIGIYRQHNIWNRDIWYLDDLGELHPQA